MRGSCMLCFSHESKGFGVVQALADCLFSIAVR